MISNSGSDERGKYSGGQAGDQTGKEWRIIAWYNRPWNVILRHPDAKVREEIALLAEKAANNNLVGYDQEQRGTYWQHLKASNYDPSQITIKCEADCSAGVLSNVKAVGYRLNIAALKNVNQDGYTGNEKAILKQAGFQVLTDKKYITSDQYLLRGDILLYEGHHTATNLTNGSKTVQSKPTPTVSTQPNTPERKGVYMFSVNEIRSGSKGTHVLLAQEILRARGYKGADGKELALDREYGPNLKHAILQYQKDREKVNPGICGGADGVIGTKTWKDMLAL